MKALVLGILASLVLTPLVVSQVPDGKLIVPGQRIGQWTLAMTIDGLVRQKGPAVTTHRPADGDAREGMTEFLWGVQFADPQQLRGDKVELIAGTRDRKKIEYLSLHGIVDLRTIKGVRVGDFWTSIEAVHGRPSAMTKWTGPEWTGAPRHWDFRAVDLRREGPRLLAGNGVRAEDIRLPPRNCQGALAILVRNRALFSSVPSSLRSPPLGFRLRSTNLTSMPLQTAARVRAWRLAGAAEGVDRPLS